MRLVGLKRLSLFCLSAALCVAGSSARADSVSFVTAGTFSAAGSDVSTGITLTAFSQGSSVTASFMPTLGFFSVPSLPSPGSSARIALGNLSITPYDFDANNPLSFNGGDQFDVTIKELDPFAPGTATLPEEITGSLSFTRSTPISGTDTGSFVFDFHPDDSAVLTAVDGRRFLYSLEDVQIDVNTGVWIFGTRPSTGTLYLDVTELAADPAADVAPLPRTASMGLALLAAVGGAAFLARRREVIA